MTDSRCWVTYENDQELQKKVEDGWFTEKETRYFALSDFPPNHFNIGYWPTVLREWCKENKLEIEQVDSLTISTKIKKNQIEDFIQYVYGKDPSYNDPAKMLMWKGRAHHANYLIDLRALVAQYLDSTLWYELNADEF